MNSFLIVFGILILIYIILLLRQKYLLHINIKQAVENSGIDLIYLLKNDKFDEAVKMIARLLPEPYRTEITVIENYLHNLLETL